MSARNQIVFAKSHVSYSGPLAARLLRHWSTPVIDPIPEVRDRVILMVETDADLNDWSIVATGATRGDVALRWTGDAVMVDRMAIR